MTVACFAYGSNLCLPRLRHRVPGVVVAGAAELRGWALRWHKRGVDGSGKCSIVRVATGDGAPDALSAIGGAVHDAVVHGALVLLPPDEKHRLDAAESLGVGYDEHEVVVVQAGVERRAMSYVARPEMRDDALRPYSWYRDLVVAGAAAHGLPPAWVASLAAVDALEDPERERDLRERRFLRDGA